MRVTQRSGSGHYARTATIEEAMIKRSLVSALLASCATAILALAAAPANAEFFEVPGAPKVTQPTCEDPYGKVTLTLPVDGVAELISPYDSEVRYDRRGGKADTVVTLTTPHMLPTEKLSAAVVIKEAAPPDDGATAPASGKPQGVVFDFKRPLC